MLAVEAGGCECCIFGAELLIPFVLRRDIRTGAVRQTGVAETRAQQVSATLAALVIPRFSNMRRRALGNALAGHGMCRAPYEGTMPKGPEWLPSE